MAKSRYKSYLPAVHLEKDDLAKLEKILRRGSNTDIEIVLYGDQLTHEYPSTEELNTNAPPPDFIQSFEINAELEEGELEIEANPENNEIEFSLRGEQEWVNKMRWEIEEFFEQRKHHLRTLAEDNLVRALTGTVFTITGFAYISGFGRMIGVHDLGDVFLAVFIALFTAPVLLSIINWMSPYSLIILDPEGDLHPYTDWILGLLTLLGVILAGIALGIQLNWI